MKYVSAITIPNAVVFWLPFVTALLTRWVCKLFLLHP